MFKKIKELFVKKPDFLLCLVLVFLGLHVFVGLEKDLFYIGGDTGIPMSPIHNLKLLFLWQNQEAGIEGLSLGGVFQLLFFAFFEFLGFSLTASQHFYIYFAHTLAGLAMYFLVNSFPIRQKRAVALIASIFYMFSPWLFNYLGIFVFLPYSVMPFILAAFVRGITGKMNWIKAIVLINLSLFGVIINFPQYSMYFVALSLMGLYFLFYVLVYRGNLWRVLKFCLLLATLTFLVSLWFILPYWQIFSSGISSELENIVPVSKAIHNFGDYGYSTILHLLRMFGAAGFLAGGATYSGSYLNNSLLILTGFLIPFLVFSALIFKPKSKAVLFFSLVAIIFIFIAKGVNSPFGFLHFWLVTKFPLARAFRTTWNLSLGANLAFAFLIGVSVVEIARRLSAGKLNGLIIVISGIMGLILINSWPLLTGAYFQLKSNPPTFEGVKIPPSYFELENYLATDRTDSRFFRIPDSRGMIRTNWGYSGSDFSFTLFSTPFVSGHPMAKASKNLLDGLYERIKNKSQLEPDIFKILSLLNIRKIIFDGYDNSSKFKIEKPILEQFGVDPQTKIGRFEIYNLSDNYFLPHFYIPERLVYTNVPAVDYLNVVDFPDYQPKSSILSLELKEQGVLEKKQDQEVIIMTDPIVSLDLEDKKQRILDRLETESKGVFFPYVKWHPGSFIYPLVLEKEKFSLKTIGQKPEEAIEKNLLFASKRIVELTRWGTVLSDEQWRRISYLYLQSMEDIFPELEKIYQGGNMILYINLFSKAQNSLIAHEKKLEEAPFLKGGYFERSEAMTKLFEKLKNNFKAINELPNLFNLNYNFEIPKEGVYELTLKENKNYFPEMTTAFTSLRIDDKEISVKDLSVIDGVIKISDSRLYKKGKHSLVVSFQESGNLLTEDKWNRGSDPLLEKQQGLVAFHFFPLPPWGGSPIVYQEVPGYISFPLPLWGGSPIVYQEVPGYVSEAYYQLSFDYIAKNDQAGVAIIQDTDVDEKGGQVNPLVLRQLQGSQGDQYSHFKTVFKSSPNSQQAGVYLLAKQEEGELNSIKFKNVRLQRVFEPKAILRTWDLLDSTVKPETPRIIFSRINSTKYKVKVEGAKAPYLLVFSESFHPGWRVYLSKLSQPELEGDEIIASYYSGLIKEGRHQNLLLAKNIFETWGQKAIAEKGHYLVNGYANAWQILPKDVGDKTNYELIIEFGPERYFYIGALISIFVFLSCFIYLILRKKK